MTALDDLAAPTSRSVRLVDRVARGLGRVSRRGFLAQTAVVGSALAVDPKGYVLTPTTAYASVCGPASTASAGYTVFCCTVNGGKNSCPPGTFSAGWWKAADSSWCCGGYRYIVDCNATCKTCTNGCAGDHICDKSCWSCACGKGSSATCDQRRYCCNAFRYGQCNTHVSCSGGVACRVVSCVAPYRWANCTTTSLRDDATAEHNAPCLQGCGPILKKYDAIGSLGSAVGASVGPERSVGDGRGRYVVYQRGRIYWTSTTGAHVVDRVSLVVWLAAGGPRGVLGYPRADRIATRDGEGWLQTFEKGMTVDSPRTRACSVHNTAYKVWLQTGRETGSLGYPTTDRTTARDGKGMIQHFERGVLADSPATVTTPVHGLRYDLWSRYGRETGALGYPTKPLVVQPNGTSWSQQFQKGAICDSARTTSAVVSGAVYQRWVQLGREWEALGYPTGFQRAGRDGRGAGQAFTGGQLWLLTGGPVRSVTGRVLARWLADGGEDGRWGYPLTDTTTLDDGRQTAVFEHGTLTV